LPFSPRSTATGSSPWLQLEFIDRHKVHFLGQPGCGKTRLAIALGVEEVKAGRSVYFCTLAELITTLAKAEREGSLPRAPALSLPAAAAHCR
jgi:DNA replication protein DnaC